MTRFLVPLTIGVVMCAPHLQSEEIPDPVMQLVDRPLQIRSGIFEFKIESSIVNLTNDELLEPKETKRFSVAFDGEDWVKNFTGHRHTTINRNGICSSFYVLGDDGPHADQRLDLNVGKTPLHALAEKEVWAKWRLIGELQRQSIGNYVSETTPTAISRAVIDKVDCLVYDYTIKQDQIFKVLTSVHPQLLEGKDVTLRLHLAKNFGFGLVRSEVIGPLGSYDVTTSAEFVEVADNVFLPVKSKHVYGPSEQAERSFIDEIELMHFRSVNVPLPPETFNFTIPAGTAVIDRRPNQPKRKYFLPEEIALSKFLDDINEK